MDIPYPLPKTKPYSGEQVKELFSRAGVAVSSWAESNGYTRHQVYCVINGQFKARRGTAREIATKLGMKLPINQKAA